MGKKIISALIVFCIVLAVFGCSKNGQHIEKIDFKVGFIMGSESYCPEENALVNQITELYGSEKIVSAVYSDDYAGNPSLIETVANQVIQDEKIKVIIFDRAVLGTATAIEKVKEERDDIYIVCIGTDEDINVISDLADLVINVDEVALGKSAVEQAKEMGAEVFVHYTYNRHIGYPNVARRMEAIEQKCKDVDIEFVLASSVDPLSSNGISGANQYIIEDAVRKQKEYTGKKIAYFSTESVVQRALIETSIKHNTILPVQVYPSPFVGFPDVLEIDLNSKQFDTPTLLEAIKEKVVEKGNEGNMATWSVSAPKLMLNAAFAYALEHVNNSWDAIDKDKIIDVFNKKSGENNIVDVAQFTNDDGKILENVFVVSDNEYNF